MGLRDLYQKTKARVTYAIDKYKSNETVQKQPETLMSSLDEIASKAETFTKPLDRNSAYFLQTDRQAMESAQKEGIYKVVDANDFLSKLYETLTGTASLEGLTEQKILSLVKAKKGCRVFLDRNLEAILQREGISLPNNASNGYDFEQVTKSLMKSALKKYVEKLQKSELPAEESVRTWARVGEYVKNMAGIFGQDNEIEGIKESVALEATKCYLAKEKTAFTEQTAIQLLLGSIQNRSRAFTERLNSMLDSAQQKMSNYYSKIKAVKEMISDRISDRDRYLHNNPALMKESYASAGACARTALESYNTWLPRQQYAY